MHAKYNSLSEATRSLSQGPCLRKGVDRQGPTQKPDLMFTRRTYDTSGIEHYKQYACNLSSPHRGASHKGPLLGQVATQLSVRPTTVPRSALPPKCLMR